MRIPAFTVIEGGLREEGRWSAELRHPASLRDPEIAAWQALLPRAVSPGVWADPDYVLTVAQHLAEGRRLALLLVWQERDGAPRLQGVLPLHLPSGLRPGRAARLWELPLAEGPAPVVAAQEAARVLRTALDHLARAGLRLETLRLPGLPPDGPLVAALREAAAETGRGLALHPQEPVAVSLLAPLPRECTSLERVRSPHTIRDAVESFLVLEGNRSGPNLLSDPAAAAALRVIMRRFAKRRACGVDLVRRDGTVVAAALRLGPAGQDQIWREAGHRLSGSGDEGSGVTLAEAVVAVAPVRRAAGLRRGGLIGWRRSA